MYAVEPGTPEGQLIRAARKRKRLSMAQAAGVLGMSAEKIGYIERGYNKLRVPYAVSDGDLAEIAAKLGIPAEELERVNRAEAAALLRGLPAVTSEPPADFASLVDRLFRALVEDRVDRTVLEFMWRRMNGDGSERTLAERMREVTDWLGDPGRAAEGARKTG